MTDVQSLFESPQFDGETHDPDRDQIRLKGQLRAVYDVLQDGHWRTLSDLARRAALKTGKHVSEASASARLRDLRKPKFGSHTIERRCRGGGLHEYRLAS